MFWRTRARPGAQQGLGDPTLSEAVDVEPDVEPETKPNSWLNTFLQGLSYGMLGLAIVAASVTVVIPKLAGAVPVTILSNSMAPSMPVGSLAIIKPNSPLNSEELVSLRPDQIRAASDNSAVQLGAVVAYQPDKNDATLIIHRIVSLSSKSDGSMTFTTKGDNNRVPDRKKVADYQVRGTVWYHLPPPIGSFNTWLNHDAEHRTTLIIVIAGVGYLWAIVLVVRAFWRRRGRGAAPDSLP